MQFPRNEGHQRAHRPLRSSCSSRVAYEQGEAIRSHTGAGIHAQRESASNACSTRLTWLWFQAAPVLEVDPAPFRHPVICR